jgi:ADP-ribose pyrophosphatase
MRPHKNARSRQNPLYPPRAAVPDDKVSWAAPWPSYEPHEFTDDSVLTKGVAQGWADPPRAESISELLYEKRVSFEGPITFDSRCRPLNPRGRTGISGRGALGKWGPNYAADPIVTRFHPRTNQLQVVAIQRKDTGAWALPGGMVDAGEAVSLTVRREFTEEAGAVTDPAEKELLESMLDELFAPSNGREIYRGYVDDPRNTDNAWMETTAMHFHCPRRLASALRLEAGDDAGKVTWLDVDPSEDRYKRLYANHRDWVDMIDKTMSQQQEHPQLLRLVVRWGRKDIAEKVLTDPDLIEQRQLPMVQGAFHEALARSTSPHFEVGLVELLLDYGARAEEVYLGGLFDSVQVSLVVHLTQVSPFLPPIFPLHPGILPLPLPLVSPRLHPVFTLPPQ